VASIRSQCQSAPCMQQIVAKVQDKQPRDMTTEELGRLLAFCDTGAGHRRGRHPDVVDADLADYFGSIPHADLLKSVARRIVDRRMLHVIKMWLECPVEETDQPPIPRCSGSAYSSLISPSTRQCRTRFEPRRVDLCFPRSASAWRNRRSPGSACGRRPTVSPCRGSSGTPSGIRRTGRSNRR
jgi:hypothetical protein